MAWLAPWVVTLKVILRRWAEPFASAVLRVVSKYFNDRGRGFDGVDLQKLRNMALLWVHFAPLSELVL
jgi:uncharacterized protein (DUF697 family)